MPGGRVAIALGGAFALFAATEFWLTRGGTAFIDEVTILQQSTGLHLSGLIAPFNEHLELARRLLYAISFNVFPGSGTYVVAKIVQSLAVIALGLSFFTFLRERLGATAALAPTVLLLFFGSGWELDFVPSGTGNVLALATGIAGLLLLQRAERRSDVLACALLIASVASFTTGTALAAGALVYLLVAPGQRKRVWVALVPLALYAAWLLWVRLAYIPSHGNVQPVNLANLLLTPNEIAQQSASTMGALAGINYDFSPTDIFGGVFTTSSSYGAILAVVALGGLLWRLRNRRAGPMLWALVAVLIVYWLELATGTGQGRDPSTVRYTYFAATVFMLLAAEAYGRPIIRRAGLVLLFAAVAFSLLGNVARLRDGMDFYRSFATAMRAQLTAIEVAAPSESPNFMTHVGRPPLVPLTVGPYLSAARRNGSPAFSVDQLRRQPLQLRTQADAMLVTALGLGLRTPATRPVSAACRHVVAASARPATYAVPGTGLILSAASSTAVSVGQFSAGAPLGTLSPGRPQELIIPHDAVAQAWHVKLSPAPSSLTLCTA